MARARSRGRRVADRNAVEQSPFGQVPNPYDPMRVLSDDQVEALHHASLRVLRDNGMEFQLPRAVGNPARGRCNGRRRTASGFHFDPAFVEEKLETVPRRFTLHGRSSHRDLEFGGNDAIWGSGGLGAQCVGSRARQGHGQFRGLQESHPASVTRSTRCTRSPATPWSPSTCRFARAICTRWPASVTLTDKPVFGYAIGHERMADAIEIARIARGIGHDDLLRQPSIHTVVNSNSPLIYDGGLLEGAIVMAELNQPVVYTPFTLSGRHGADQRRRRARAPERRSARRDRLLPVRQSRCAGRLRQLHLERGHEVGLAGLRNAGIRPRPPSPPANSRGATASRGAHPTPQRPTRPTPRRHTNRRCPSGRSSSPRPTTSSTGSAGSKAGFARPTRSSSWTPKMVQMMQAFLKPLDTSEEELGLDAIAEVGPGGHFFGCDHTMARYETAFYRPMLSDWRNFENWRDTPGRGRDIGPGHAHLEAASCRLRSTVRSTPPSPRSLTRSWRSVSPKGAPRNADRRQRRCCLARRISV